MPEVSKATLKTYFEDGKEPDENKFIDLIDTMALISGVVGDFAVGGDLRVGGDEAGISMRADQGMSHSFWNDQGGYASHFDDGSTPIPLNWHTWRSHTPFSIPGGTAPNMALGYSVMALDYSQIATKCFYSRWGTATLMRFIPHFHSVSKPIRVGIRWDISNDNSYCQIYWEIMNTFPPKFDLKMDYRSGGGGVTTLDLHSQTTMDFPNIYAVVEGTQWSSWGVRPFMMGRTGGVVWLGNSTGLNWTPLHHGMFWDNSSGATTTWQNAGFDAYGFG